MSDVELEYEEEEEGNAELKLITQRTLVYFVKENPALYSKKLKEYSGKNFDKTLAWHSIGEAMVPPMTGEEVQKEFYKIRQKFGKEWRLYQLSLKGKSGQATTSIYTSKWELYEDCMFLADHIVPRKTTSSYQSVKQVKTSRTMPLLPCSSSSSSSPLRPPPPKTIAPKRPCPSPSSSLWSSDGEIFQSEGESSDPVPESPEASREQVLAAMSKAASTAKHLTPQPDKFAKTKRKQDDEFLKAMAKQSEDLTTVVKELGQALASVSTVPNGSGPAEQAPAPNIQDPVMIAIQYALKSVPEDRKVACMTDILNLISSKYINK